MDSLNIFNKNDKFLVVTPTCSENKKKGCMNINYGAKTKKEAKIIAGPDAIAIFKLKSKKQKS